MPGMGHLAAEEFYSQCMANSRVLDEAARRYATVGDGPSLLACAWTADVWLFQALVWERIMVAAPNPQRQFFRVAESLFAGLTAAAPPADHPWSSCAEMLTAARDAVLDACDPALRGDIRQAWSDLAYASAVDAPTVDEVLEAGRARLHGMSPEAFAASRRSEMVRTMAEAQEQRVRGETLAAVQRAYEADFLGLEAYLVESAVACGDNALLTVTARWELAVAAVSALSGLPEGFVAAVAAVRDALASALADADGARLRASLVVV